MTDEQRARLNQLYKRGQADPDVKLMIGAVTMKHGCDIFVLAEEHPEAFDMLFEAADIEIEPDGWNA